MHRIINQAKTQSWVLTWFLKWRLARSSIRSACSNLTLNCLSMARGSRGSRVPLIRCRTFHNIRFYVSYFVRLIFYSEEDAYHNTPSCSRGIEHIFPTLSQFYLAVLERPPRRVSTAQTTTRGSQGPRHIAGTADRCSECRGSPHDRASVSFVSRCIAR